MTTMKTLAADRAGGICVQQALQRAFPDRFARWTLLYVVAWTVFRLWFCTTIELVGDEAYYWVWSRNLDWCYFSKGPLVAWTIALGTRLFGDTVFGVRVFSVLLSAGTSWLLYMFGRTLFSSRVGFWSVVTASVTPLFLVGSILMTIDPLSVFFWAAASLAFWHAKDSPGVGPWVGTGLLVGIGALGKYTNMALLPSFALFCLFTRPYRRILADKKFWAMVVAALLCLLPVVWWNYRHDWITLVHLRERGALDRPWRFSPQQLFSFLGMQLGVWFPSSLVGLFAVLFSRRVREDHPIAFRYAVSLFAPLFILYTILALNDAGQPNWTAPCFVSGLTLLTAGWLRWSDAHRAARRAAVISLGLAGLVTVAFLVITALPNPFPRDPLARVRGSRDMARKTAVLQREYGADFLIAKGYQLASLLSFYLPEHPQVFIPYNATVRSQYHLWPGYRDLAPGQNALFVEKNDWVPESLLQDFGEITPRGTMEISSRDRTVRTLHVFLCRRMRQTAPAGETGGEE